MSERPRPLIAGNWKMNGVRASLEALTTIAQGYDAALRSRADLLVCPPATLLCAAAAAALGTGLLIGGQDCHAEATGAHTGDVSAAMVADCGASFCIVGHSERRADHGETDAIVHAKAAAAIGAGLIAIVCVGESEAARRGGHALAVIGAQLAGSLPEGADAERLVVAYEPIWAIGTGLTPMLADVAQVHDLIRDTLKGRVGDPARVRILYGGSVKPSNAAGLMGVRNVDGALVGGASLDPADFLAIAAVYR